MTAKERAKIRKAIDLLMDENCLMLEALTLLGSMCGVIFPASQILSDKSARRMDPRELAGRPNSAFVAYSRREHRIKEGR
jgi:hypothetical protein